ncbi:hypothetical protein D3C76_815050 [compost metagenome]
MVALIGCIQVPRALGVIREQNAVGGLVEHARQRSRFLLVNVEFSKHERERDALDSAQVMAGEVLVEMAGGQTEMNQVFL